MIAVPTSIGYGASFGGVAALLGMLKCVGMLDRRDGRWQLRLWWKPFVTFIWYGGLLVALGGALSIVGRLQADLRRRNARRLINERRTERESLA